MNHTLFSNRAEPKIKSGWLPLLVGLLLCALSALFCWLLEVREGRYFFQTIERKTEELVSYIEADMRSRLPALQRIANRWRVHGGLSQREFESDAYDYINDLPGFHALEWVDEQFFVRWIVPLAGNEKAQGMNLAFEENRRIALEKAKALGARTMTSPIDLVQGGKGFLVYFPLYTDNDFKGFLIAVFRIREWLDFVFSIRERSEDKTHYTVSVFFDGQPVFFQGDGGSDSQSASAFQGMAETRILNHRFAVRCTPKQSFIEESNSLIPELAAVVGLLVSTLVASVIHLFQKASVEAWRSYAARTAVEVEIRERKKTEAELQQTSARLSMATKAGSIGVWTWDIASGRLTWNDLMYAQYAFPPDVVPTYATWRSKVHPDDLAVTEELLQAALDGIRIFDTEFRITRPDGAIRSIRAAAKVERDETTGAPLRMTGVSWDISDQKEAEELLATERRRLSDILQGTNVGTWEWNVQTGETIFNERWAGIIGYSLEEISPVSIDTWVRFAHPEDLKTSDELLKKHFRRELEYYECEVRMRHKEGRWVWVFDRGKVSQWTEDGKPLLMSGTHQDITARKNAEERIQHLATHDALTGLPSLRLARDRLSQAIVSAKRNQYKTSVLFVDLDGFKAVNDGHGHDAGDILLKEVAQRLQACVREADTVARIGGDEFLIIANEIRQSEDAANISRKILEHLQRPFNVGTGDVNIGVSIGISIYPDNGSDEDTLVKKADTAMYAVKHSGKNNYAFASRTEAAV